MAKLGPCKNCEKRHLACHDHCEDYISWKAEWDKEQEYQKRMINRCDEAVSSHYSYIDKVRVRKEFRYVEQ